MNTTDADRIGRLMLAVEAKAHRRGWDSEPLLLAIYDGDVPHPLKPGRWISVDKLCAACIVPPGSGALDPNAAHGLFILAMNVGNAEAHPHVRYVLDGLRGGGRYVGTALLFESWSWFGTPEERAALGNRDLADTPGAVESRGVWAATTAGLFAVHRQRGDKPQLISPDDPSGEVVAGSVPESLAVITAVVRGEEPPARITTPHGWERRTAGGRAR